MGDMINWGFFKRHFGEHYSGIISDLPNEAVEGRSSSVEIGPEIEVRHLYNN